MKQRLNWQGKKNDENEWFPASVPGTIQHDYAEFHNWGDVNYADNAARYKELEDSTWFYRAEFEVPKKENVFFVSGGIDYIYDIILNGEVILSHEGMFTPVDLDISDKLSDGKNTIEVKIYPHPKRPGAAEDRSQADNCCKPPVCYEWDWHPRLLVSGIWNDAFIEVRDTDYIKKCDVSYTLSDNKTNVVFDTDSGCEIEIFAPDGTSVYKGTDTKITIENPLLWWCNGHGEPNLYSYRVKNKSDEKCGKIGFRTIELVMSDENAWMEPKSFPKTRSVPPTQILLNGKRIFAKGSNFVSPDIFIGSMTIDAYQPLVKLAKDANMNIFRIWGGSGIGKKAFYDLCDEYGIMVWQEFPLACNNYVNEPHYLEILKQEATEIVCTLRTHPSVILWCGGNELFNGWSRMTDQSLALRLLNKICYEYDPDTPFIATAPLMGMAHGSYLFYLIQDEKEVYEVFNNSRYTAYSEFGIRAFSDEDILNEIVPENELIPSPDSPTWDIHFTPDWYLNVFYRYFGKPDTFKEYTEKSQWLQCEGYKAIFEEARRQKPYCSMAINWCFNEPWKTTTSNSIITYPSRPKKAYYNIKNSCSPVIPSARLNKFTYEGGEIFSAELWLLNDSYEKVNDTISAYIEIGGECCHVMDWETPLSGENENIKGHIMQFVLPDVDADRFVLKLKSKKYGENSYTLRYSPKETITRKRRLNE